MLMVYPPKSDRYMQYREMMFENGFSEAKQKTGHFFRQATEQTAFVINFEDDEESCITILYGFASTAYMIGDEEWFANHGSDMDDCQVRNILSVWDDESETAAKTNISIFYEQYKSHTKRKDKKNFSLIFLVLLNRLVSRKKEQSGQGNWIMEEHLRLMLKNRHSPISIISMLPYIRHQIYTQHILMSAL